MNYSFDIMISLEIKQFEGAIPNIWNGKNENENENESKSDILSKLN